MEITPVFHEVQPGQTLAKISQIYKTSIDRIALLNGIYDVDDLRQGQLLLISYNDSRGPDAVPPPPSSYKPQVTKSKLLWPVIGGRGKFTSGFGKRWGRSHKGIDIADKPGTGIVAAHSGEVQYSGNGLSGFGNLVIIKGDDGLKTVYAHNKKNLVSKGERVDRGERIALLGSTGRSTGPHLHFEVRRTTRDGQVIAVDPMEYIGK